MNEHIDRLNIMYKIRSIADTFGLDPLLVAAICKVESNFNPCAARYEPEFKYLSKPEYFAEKNGSSLPTEIILQKTSLGIMQIMGCCAREWLHEGWLTELFTVEVGLRLGCQHLKHRLDKYQDTDLAIAAYNAGSPRLINRRLMNQSYVDKVKIVMGDKEFA